MRPAPCEFNFSNWRFTIFAQFTTPTIDFKIGRKLTGLAVAPNIIFRRGAAFLDGQAQNFFDGAKKFLELVDCECLNVACGPNFGCEATLIHINIAEAGNECLIKECLFESAIGIALELSRKIFEREIWR